MCKRQVGERELGNEITIMHCKMPHYKSSTDRWRSQGACNRWFMVHRYHHCNSICCAQNISNFSLAPAGKDCSTQQKHVHCTCHKRLTNALILEEWGQGHPQRHKSRKPIARGQEASPNSKETQCWRPLWPKAKPLGHTV